MAQNGGNMNTTEHANGTTNSPPEFSFDWVLKGNDMRRPALLNLYTANGWDVPLVKVQIRDRGMWYVKYEVGNPLLGGIKTYTSYRTAEKKFFELVGRIHRDAEIRASRGE